MIEIRNLTVRFDDSTPLENFNATLPDEGVVAVYGRSGKGKSTLLKVLAGLIEPTGGEVTGLDDKRISVVFQEDRLLPWRTALQNVELVCNDFKKAEDALEAMELKDAAHKRPAELSGGMKRRVALARALAFGGDILLLDEPFTGLDDELKARVIEKTSRAFPLIVIATHDEQEARALGVDTEIRV